MSTSCNKPLRSRANQRGISLLEALISVLLIAITGLGLAHVTVQALAVQRYATTENQVLLGLREALLMEDSINRVSVAGSELGFVRQSESLSVTVRVGTVDKTVNLQTETLSVTDDPGSLVGGDGQFRLDY
ncbi:hypothetical protein SAMN05216198_2435 [Halopseudomonas litoralis]|uniref:Type IV pilus assembly protein PilV n=1 Tax=Halopseudomonas litoralis TaxID=797277 RepID=A0A1H1TXX1_9GAMM|nr:prepilin-type N-terminal cleavage/methylation domain-containing protein [Halopseudomonas litoralis]SDS65097.1 hypothetical protein SAMN05216198_2435 [Halopseudomonas litoralis]